MLKRLIAVALIASTVTKAQSADLELILNGSNDTQKMIALFVDLPENQCVEMMKAIHAIKGPTVKGLDGVDYNRLDAACVPKSANASRLNELVEMK